MFREKFKYYKSKDKPPDLNRVLDFETSTGEIVHSLSFDKQFQCRLVSSPGLKPPNMWKAYEINQHPGLIVIRNPFTIVGQRYWIARCLADYTRAPNLVNLNANLFADNVIKDWWQALQTENVAKEKLRLKTSLRWTTLGYHHDWDSKVYSKAKWTHFPSDLHSLSVLFANAIGYDGFDAQAAIINYYPIGSTLAPHTDHSELNLTAPLLSFSFGQTAIFLIGTENKEDEPTALYLRSGDVLVMSGQSRTCYHAVPRVFREASQPWNIPASEIIDLPMESGVQVSLAACKMDTLVYSQVAYEKFWKPFNDYLMDSRINVNVRQVLNNDNDEQKLR